MWGWIIFGAVAAIAIIAFVRGVAKLIYDSAPKGGL